MILYTARSYPVVMASMELAITNSSKHHIFAKSYTCAFSGAPPPAGALIDQSGYGVPGAAAPYVDNTRPSYQTYGNNYNYQQQGGVQYGGSPVAQAGFACKYMQMNAGRCIPWSIVERPVARSAVFIPRR